MSYQVTNEDQKFLNDVESSQFPVSNFDHRAHLRLAYVYLAETRDVEKSLKLVRKVLLGLLKHAGIEPSTKYHETLTKAWLLAVHHFMHTQNHTHSADEFIDQNFKLLNSKIMLTHYSEDVLFSKEAKKKFMNPNLEPIPRYAGLPAKQE